MNACPTRDQLDELLCRPLNEIENNPLVIHVGHCPRCQQRLLEMTNADHVARWRSLIKASYAVAERSKARPPSTGKPAAKPALSVPRWYDPSDSFLFRLKRTLPRVEELHRLDSHLALFPPADGSGKSAGQESPAPSAQCVAKNPAAASCCGVSRSCFQAGSKYRTFTVVAVLIAMSAVLWMVR